MKKIKIQFGTLALCSIAIVVSSVVTSCSKSSSSSTGPKVTSIDGYDSSGQVASANLVAYFPFNGNGNDVKGGESGSATGNVQYVTGVLGQAYQGDTTGTYITCAANANLASLRSYTVSVWIKTPPSAKKPGNGTPATAAQGIFFMGTASGNFVDELIIENDNASANQRATDSAAIHFGFNDPGSTGWQQFVLASYAQDTASAGWMHVVMTYDSSSSNLIEYVNGVANGSQSAWSNGLFVNSNQILDGPTGTGNPIGNLNLSSATPTTITIGSWPAAGLFGLGSANSFAGNIDELRIYNRALSSTEVLALYANGKAGQ